MTPDPTAGFSASDWLRQHLDASIHAGANVEEYTQIDVVVSEPGHADRSGHAWTIDGAVARAVGQAS